MNPMKVLIHAALLAVTSAAAAPAFAQVPPLPDASFCADYPERCEEMKKHHADYCRANPKTCGGAGKEAREEPRVSTAPRLKEAPTARQEACKANPSTCARKPAPPAQAQAQGTRKQLPEFFKRKKEKEIGSETAEDTSKRP